jgi:hypothetical protein
MTGTSAGLASTRQFRRSGSAVISIPNESIRPIVINAVPGAVAPKLYGAKLDVTAQISASSDFAP